MSVKTRRLQRGHAMLEGALILTIFVGFLLGTIDFAQFLYFHQSLVERARVAARYAIVHPDDVAGTKNVAVYNNAAGGATPVVYGLTTDQVSMELASAGTPEARVKVTIRGFGFRFFSLGISGTRTAAAVSATMLSEAP